jgi:hypothetical protein
MVSRGLYPAPVDTADPPVPDRGDGWPLAYAAALAELGGGELALTPPETAALLRMARDVAHGTERRFAPLAAYLAGRFVAERLRAGAGAEEALAEATAAAARLIDRH